MLQIKTARLILPVLLLIFGLGVIRLFAMRFERGDVYPVYSSLRADPLGTKALYEGLDALPGVAVSRNYRPLYKLLREGGTTLFYFGLKADRRMNERDVKALEDMARNGGRVVILLYPESRRRAGNEADKDEVDKADTQDHREGEGARGKAVSGEKPVSIFERWGLGLANDGPLPKDGPTAAYSPTLPHDRVPWHSTLYFGERDEAWRGIYSANGRDVIVERQMGRGTIAVATDSFFVSNEAMRLDRHPALLAWIVGNNRKVLFDETHLGIHNNPGIAALARRYRLHWPAAGIVLIAILFIWKNSFSLVPSRDSAAGREEGTAPMGKDSVAALSGLLRRNVPADTITEVCFNEWEKTSRLRKGAYGDALERMWKIVKAEEGRPAGRRGPLEAYIQMRKILLERNARWTRT